MEQPQQQDPNTTTTTTITTTEVVLEIPRHKTKTIQGRLPLDSLLQIWSHLPTPSLYRFRPVSSFWSRLIISDPLLPCLRHRLSHPHPPPPTLLLILTHSPSQPLKHPDRPARLSTRPASHILLRPDPNPNPAVHTYALKNGFTPYIDHDIRLVPNANRLSPLTCFSSFTFFYLCNPSTNQFYRVSSTSTLNGAFGYFHVENCFALVNILGTKVEVFEFGPGKAGLTDWRELNSTSPTPVRGFGIMVDGLYFWTAASAGSSPGFVVCLDYKNERFSLIPPPEGNPGEVMMYDQMYLVEFKGAVCAVDNFSRPPRMEIWVLSRNGVGVEEGFSWVRKYNVFMTGMSRDLVYPFCDYYFYDENEDDEKKRKEKSEMIVLCNGTRSRLYCYNLKSRSIKQVYKPKQRSFEQLALYTPGLFPLIMDL